ncbi:methyl-accepting chemotaxis protein [Paenibacillus sp. KQZ6P-2]|uniref:Methyl-accepting chemotaxis protein n=1 Tax=Paenibacillus mangrovi TaxID=2931978 RepID=A0A9X1WPM5_9BACL|nr:methyl-accepting chemotaxis protein [Paenibacillus mangrovi]MCJ8011665.1 methyl-accepting chemotaxis protein [Paenibacillus mangrovi]
MRQEFNAVGEEMGEVQKKEHKEGKKNRFGKLLRKEKQGETSVSGQAGVKKEVFSIRDAASRLKRLNPTKSVGVKLFLIFFIAIVSFVLILGLLSYNKAKSTIKDNAAMANKQTMIQTSEKLDIILNQYEDMTMQIFFDPETQKMIDQMSSTEISGYDMFVLNDKISKKLSNQINSNSSIKAIYLIPPNANQNPIMAGVASTDMNAIRDQAWYERAQKQNKAFWVPTEKGKDGESNFKMVRPMQSLSGGGKTFVIVIELKTSLIEDQLKAINLGEGSKLQLISPDNKVVGSSQANEAGEVSDFAFMKDQKDDSNSLYTEDSEKHNILAGYNTLKTTGWRLVGTIPTELLVKDAQGILVLTLSLVLVVVIIAILIGFWMVLMIAKPLSRLKDLMIEGSKGNLKVRMENKSSDEIGELGRSFNLMMDQITNLVQQTNTTALAVLETASELTDASKKTALSAKEIAVATEEIASGASSLATEAERGNELTDNISRQMQLVVTANDEMSSSAHHVEESSDRGTKHLNNLMEKTHRTEDMTRSLMHKVDNLKQTTMSVNKVLEVLQNITKQTNILSLNATIEAARAGAAGKGFMVVADEIRQLAEQSRQSIDMVGQITEKIMHEMNETVEALQEANPLFQEQMNSVKETNDIFVSVREQMSDFTQRLDTVTQSIETLNHSQEILSDAMSNVSAVAEESSATSEEVASLSNEQQSISSQLVQLSGKLENVSNELKETLSRFTI